jgi:hypothetical protein
MPGNTNEPDAFGRTGKVAKRRFLTTRGSSDIGPDDRAAWRRRSCRGRIAASEAGRAARRQPKAVRDRDFGPVPELDGYGLRIHIVCCADEVKPALTSNLAR